MKYELEKIKEFRQKFNLSIKSNDVDKKLHLNLIKEEYYELIESIEQDDYANVLKEFVDLIYVIGGYLLDEGIDEPLDYMFDNVTINNMSKLDKNGKPMYREDGKLLKPDDFVKLNPDEVINNYYNE